MKVVGYTRVSTAEQGDSGLGLSAQAKAIEDECARRGWVLDRVETDVLSGRSMSRPGLQSALADCDTGAVDGIIVSKLDRLSRSLIDFAGLVERARRQGFNIVALDLGVDLSTPNGEFLAGMMAVMAQWERRIIGQRTKDALAVARARGVRLGRPPAVPPALVARIRRARKGGASLSAIARRLNDEGVPTAHGGARWYPSTIRALLTPR